MKLLLVDDERLSRTLMADGLRTHGFDVREAENGDEALDLYEDDAFDVVVTDIIMAGSDGYDLAEKIHQICDQAQSPLPRLVALTGSVTDQSDAQRFSGVFDLVLSKPISVGDVALSLLRLPTTAS